jgi:hypothetical protein
MNNNKTPGSADEQLADIAKEFVRQIKHALVGAWF